MEKQRAIPQGFLTVGEVAKKMNVTVRTLQHYDGEGLLPPSSVSEGGRRLYTDRGYCQAASNIVFETPGLFTGRHQKPSAAVEYAH